jgi:hypothetical protein
MKEDVIETINTFEVAIKEVDQSETTESPHEEDLHIMKIKLVTSNKNEVIEAGVEQQVPDTDEITWAIAYEQSIEDSQTSFDGQLEDPLAHWAMFLLDQMVPFPRDENFGPLENGLRFCVYCISEDKCLVMDLHTGGNG